MFGEGGLSFGSFLLNVIVIFLFVMWFWLLITVFSDLFRRKDISGGSKALWVIFLIVLPYLGIFIYIVTQGEGMSGRQQERAVEARDVAAHLYTVR